ncbi:TetR/AcrR family transcriptional regulator [Nocardioides solisilvae]|uniref:TetR/AcrR family transcriptional regulator n=1 Tax=Nocardioides solisilvae TaxID=1542435 RepID=UPI000D74FF6F|nr:TetR/AcrR family transcriptional regulator [Nocardioides solisilvae]
MATKKPRSRMTGAERREQLIEVARSLFAERGFDGTAVEEVAARAGVSKPVVYEHFGGKEGLYAVVVDREVTQLLTMMRGSLTSVHSHELLADSAVALLDFIESNPDGFRILVRDSPVGASTSTFKSIIGDVASRVEGILVQKFTEKELDPKVAPMYAQMLVGMVAMVGQWWLDTRRPAKEIVAAHLVNLAWNGLSGMERSPVLPGSGDAPATP